MFTIAFEVFFLLALLEAYLTELWITDAEIIANLRQRLLFRGEHLPYEISLQQLRQKL